MNTVTVAAVKHPLLKVAFDNQAVVGMPYAVEGNIFVVEHSYFMQSDTVAWTFTLRVRNDSGLWISVDIDRADGGRTSTGSNGSHIEPGQYGGFTESLSNYLGPRTVNTLNRWRPGFLGIPGNGGGAIWFQPPAANGAALLDITVIG